MPNAASNPSIVVARGRDSARAAGLRRRWSTRAGVRLPPDRRRKTRIDEPAGAAPRSPRRSKRRQRMKRYLLLLAASISALAVVLPATAGAATFRGAVVAKDAARKALVTASKD